MNDSSIKTKVIQQVEKVLNDRLNALTFQVEELQQALQNDTKSSAGDKHETSRAMTQLELEKLSQQLLDVSQHFETFHRIRLVPPMKKSQLGSLIETSEGTYYLSIPLGKLAIENQVIIFCLSPISPLGQRLIGRSKDETIEFNGRFISVNGVL